MPLQLIAWKDSWPEMTCYVSSGTLNTCSHTRNSLTDLAKLDTLVLGVNFLSRSCFAVLALTLAKQLNLAITFVKCSSNNVVRSCDLV